LTVEQHALLRAGVGQEFTFQVENRGQAATQIFRTLETEARRIVFALYRRLASGLGDTEVNQSIYGNVRLCLRRSCCEGAMINAARVIFFT